MKKGFRLLVFALGVIAVMPTFAQKENVGIGTSKPDESAVLDVSSSTKGFLMPRMSLQQRNSIQNPAKGLMVYQTDLISGLYYYDGVAWKSIGSEKSVAGTDGDWATSGNAATAGMFLGTTNSIPLVFKVENSNAGFISLPTAFNTFLGSQTPSSSITGIGNTGIGTNALSATATANNNTAVGANSQKLTTAASNTSVGSASLFSNTTGESNTAIGAATMFSNIGGSYNVGIGGEALRANTSGQYNMGIGFASLYTNSTGSNNMAIGTEALRFSTGSYNTAVGTWAGRGTASYSGSGNIFIGYSAGSSEIASNKLYIANSNTTTPLVYGDLSADFLAVGGVDATAAKRDNLSASYGLLVRKGILTEKIKVATMTSGDWADYVFDNDYKRMPLEEVEAFVKENKHLPNVPTTAEMMSNGNDLMKTDAKLLEKIEELTLYMIEMNKEIKALKEENAKLKNK